MPNNKEREPKKTWYWVAFTGAIFVFIIAVLQVIYMKTPKVGPCYEIYYELRCYFT